ncbi:cupin domain-containing protein [Massilia niastensis]|uniref:cupin domain-containing protein n=1 Tax=Massilia niastensis TaxID=544911 RepID=UPI001E54ACD7|nr:cupin domain-containing protein [Massilia niastensis]
MLTKRFVNMCAAAAVTGASMLVAVSAQAHGPADAPAGGEKIKLVQQQVLKEAPGKEIQVITVDYLPGQVSTPHVHPGTVIAYVLEGAVVSQLEGGKEVTYRAGEAWYEPPEVPHLVSRNASRTKPAKLLVYLVTGEGEPVLRPLSRK